MAHPNHPPSLPEVEFRKDVEDFAGSTTVAPADADNNGVSPVDGDYDVETVEKVYKKIDWRIIPRMSLAQLPGNSIANIWQLSGSCTFSVPLFAPTSESLKP
jgi:hypothetical protein